MRFEIHFADEAADTAWASWLRAHAWETGKDRTQILWPADVRPLFLAWHRQMTSEQAVTAAVHRLFDEAEAEATRESFQSLAEHIKREVEAALPSIAPRRHTLRLSRVRVQFWIARKRTTA